MLIVLLLDLLVLAPICPPCDDVFYLPVSSQFLNFVFKLINFYYSKHPKCFFYQSYKVCYSLLI